MFFKPPGATLPGVLFAFLFLAAGLAVCGCSEIQAPNAYEAMTHPFGSGVPFSRGSTQQEVRAVWGEPDQILPLGRDELGNLREEWIYTGRYPGMPVDYGYVSKSQRLYFEGMNLVRWRSEEPAASHVP